LSLESETLNLMVEKLKHKLTEDVQLKGLLSGSAFILAFKILGAFSSYIFFYLLAIRYGAKGVGIFSLSFTLLSIFVMLSKLGMDSLIVKQIPEYKAKGIRGAERSIYNKLIGIVLSFSIGMSVLVYYSSNLFSVFFQYPELEPSMRIIAIAIIPSVILSMNAECLRGLEQMKYFAYLQNGSVMMLSVLGLIIGSSLFDRGESTPIFVYFIAVCIVAVLSIFIISKKLPKSASLVKSSILKATLKLSVPMLISGAVFMIMNWTDVLMLGYYSDEDQVGIYNLCFKLASIITFAQFAINSYAAPRISSYFYADKLEDLKALISKIAWLNFVISIPFFVVLLVFGAQILPLFGAEFESGIIVLLLLIVGQLINALSGPVLYILNMTGKEFVARNIVLVAALINVVLNLILIPSYGIIGAAVAATVAMLVWNICSLVYIYKNYGLLTVVYFSAK